MKTLHQKLIESGALLESHYSDLYTPYTVESARIVRESGLCWGTFVSNIDGKLWIEVPFAHEPYWQRRTAPIPASALVATVY